LSAATILFQKCLQQMPPILPAPSTATRLRQLRRVSALPRRSQPFFLIPETRSRHRLCADSRIRATASWRRLLAAARQKAPAIADQRLSKNRRCAEPNGSARFVAQEVFQRRFHHVVRCAAAPDIPEQVRAGQREVLLPPTDGCDRRDYQASFSFTRKGVSALSLSGCADPRLLTDVEQRDHHRGPASDPVEDAVVQNASENLCALAIGVTSLPVPKTTLTPFCSFGLGNCATAFWPARPPDWLPRAQPLYRAANGSSNSGPPPSLEAGSAPNRLGNRVVLNSQLPSEPRPTRLQHQRADRRSCCRIRQSQQSCRRHRA